MANRVQELVPEAFCKPRRQQIGAQLQRPHGWKLTDYAENLPFVNGCRQTISPYFDGTRSRLPDKTDQEWPRDAEIRIPVSRCLTVLCAVVVKPRARFALAASPLVPENVTVLERFKS